MQALDNEVSADEIQVLLTEFVQLGRVALGGESHQAQSMLRRLARQYRPSHPEFAASLVELLREAPVRSGGSRGRAPAQPLDDESRLPLVRQEYPVSLHIEPVLPTTVSDSLLQLADEHAQAGKLLAAGLTPTRTALFVGPPGSGKTLSARWIARRLDLPILTLDLASVMSSFLGRTGTNLRRVLDYAKQTPCVLLLDELDAVAKRRDDATEIGELKRLVTVLLQEIDQWPVGSLLLAATNHPELLDPAIWRRFEVVAKFPLPDRSAIALAIPRYLADDHLDADILKATAGVYVGAALSEVERDMDQIRRIAILRSQSIQESLFNVISAKLAAMPASARGPIAAALMKDSGLSQRRVHELTGVSRDTLRKYASTA